MIMEELHGGFVTKLLGQAGRADNVGKNDGANPWIARVRASTREDDRAGRVDFAATEKPLSQIGIDLDHFVGHVTMGFAMNAAGGFGVRRLDEAEDLTSILIQPILAVLDVVFSLLGDVREVDLRDLFRSCFSDLVNIKIQGHDEKLVSQDRSATTRAEIFMDGDRVSVW